MNLQRSRVRESNHLRADFHPHLQSIVERPGNWTKWIALVHFRNGGLRVFLFTVPNERNPSVDTARRGTACKCEDGSDTDRNTKIHVVRLTDEALCCKP